MDTLKVIKLKSEVKSFSHNNGLYAIRKQYGDSLYLWKIKDGILQKYQDGSPNLLCLDANNKGITPTDLLIQI